MTAYIQVSGLSIRAPGDRVLLDSLELRLPAARVALVGRNGVGKSTLLSVLAGCAEAHAGRVAVSSPPYFVPQILARTAPAKSSHGEQRKAALLEAQTSGAEVVLLDEPSEDLDEAALAWLRGWLRRFPGCALVASHDRRLLADFRHFFVLSESGGRYFSGTLAELDDDLERERKLAERRYAGNLQQLAAKEEHSLQVLRRKARKKRYGRCRELDRGTPRIRLNQKRSDAQNSHGRLAKLREQKLDELRQWSLATRRALTVDLPLELTLPTLPEAPGEVLALRSVSARSDGRSLFDSLDLTLGRQRVALTGPNGAGKTTLLQIALGARAPDTGSAWRDSSRLGSISQGAADWRRDDSLFALLQNAQAGTSHEKLAQQLVAHRFPLALAERPLRSLSPGERTRAALICLFQRSPAVEVLVLDEPTFSLDLVGQRALTRALLAWSGGLLVASHDRAFLAAINANRILELGSPQPPTAA
jgi:ATPase subunit of ABC transporter with duplicated ATPase domains